VRAAAWCVALAVLCAVGVVVATATARGAAPLQKVTFIGDSVATEILDHAEAAKIAAQGVNMDFQLAPCRRLDGVSCPYEGKVPETALQLIADLGPQLAPTVIVAVGYNDYEDQYAGEIDKTLAALEQNGVQRVLWLTLRATRQSYLSMNDDILAAAAKHPELTVVDWNGASLSHDEWFGDDGLHLQTAGANAMATLIHRTLVQLGVAAGGFPVSTQTTAAPTPLVRVTTRTLPTARLGAWYRARLAAAAGVPPYSWAFPKNPPDRLHVRADGTIFGTPAGKTGTFKLPVVVIDAAGTRASATLTLRVAK